jgi:hypothetical protein
MKMEPVGPAASGTSVHTEMNKFIGALGTDLVQMFINQMQSMNNYTYQQVKEELNDS